MDDSNDFEVDPALAAAMGFSGFGTQPNSKKRKFNNTTEGFVDPEISKAKGAGATGANNVPVAIRESKNVKSVEEGSAKADVGADVSAAGGVTDGEKPSLEALRHGVRNSRGDAAYFLPSFLEDPWKGLEAR